MNIWMKEWMDEWMNEEKGNLVRVDPTSKCVRYEGNRKASFHIQQDNNCFRQKLQ